MRSGCGRIRTNSRCTTTFKDDGCSRPSGTMIAFSELVITKRQLTSLRNESGFMGLADELLFTRRALATREDAATSGELQCVSSSN
jgi:hypothetical protein